MRLLVEWILISFFVGAEARSNWQEAIKSLTESGLMLHQSQYRMFLKDGGYQRVLKLKARSAGSWEMERITELYNETCSSLIAPSKEFKMTLRPTPETASEVRDYFGVWGAVQEMDALFTQHMLIGAPLSVLKDHPEYEMHHVDVQRCHRNEKVYSRLQPVFEFHLHIYRIRYTFIGDVFQVMHPGRFITNGSFYIYPQLPDIYIDYDGAISTVENCSDWNDERYTCELRHNGGCNVRSLDGCPMHRVDARCEGFLFLRKTYDTVLIATHLNTFKLEHRTGNIESREVPTGGVFLLNCNEESVPVFGVDHRMKCYGENEERRKLKIPNVTAAEKNYIAKLEQQIERRENVWSQGDETEGDRHCVRIEK